jgi:hypothetical protein
MEEGPQCPVLFEDLVTYLRGEDQHRHDEKKSFK